MSFKQNLLDILSDLKKHKRGNENLIEYYVQKRLNKSLKNYCEDLYKDSSFILQKDARKMLQALSK